MRFAIEKNISNYDENIEAACKRHDIITDIYV